MFSAHKTPTVLVGAIVEQNGLYYIVKSINHRRKTLSVLEVTPAAAEINIEGISLISDNFKK